MRNQVVARYQTGQTVKGTTGNFSPAKQFFHVDVGENTIAEVWFKDLKAVFFVKDLSSTSRADRVYTDDVSGGGRKITVEFQDGERIVGFTNSYSADRQGFFLLPADHAGNNQRIFVVNMAVKTIDDA